MPRRLALGSVRKNACRVNIAELLRRRATVVGKALGTGMSACIDVLARGSAAWLDGKAGGLDLGGAADRDGTPDTFTLTEAETMAQEILAEAFAGGVPETRREAGREPRRRYAPGEDAGDDRAALRGAGKTAMAYGFLRSRSIPIGVTETAAIVRARTGHGLWPGNGPHVTRADAAESVFNGVAKTLGTAYRLQ